MVLISANWKPQPLETCLLFRVKKVHQTQVVVPATRRFFSDVPVPIRNNVASNQPASQFVTPRRGDPSEAGTAPEGTTRLSEVDRESVQSAIPGRFFVWQYGKLGAILCKRLRLSEAMPGSDVPQDQNLTQVIRISGSREESVLNQFLSPAACRTSACHSRSGGRFTRCKRREQRRRSMVAKSGAADRKIGSLFDSLQSLGQADNVSTEILSVRATVFVGTVCLQLVGSSNARTRSNETNVSYVRHKQITVRPRRRRILRRVGDQSIVRELV